MEYRHIPVMLDEVITALNLKKGQVVIDCTLGGGGYSMAAAKLIGKTGRVLSIDLDELALNNARHLFLKNNIENILLAQGNFRNITDLAEENLGENVLVDAIMVDLGFSSAQLDDVDRGLSFLVDGPLDMSFDKDGVTTKQIVNKWKEAELTRIFRDYGEERFAFRAAKLIVEYRRNKKIETVKELVDIINKAIPAANKRQQNIHFATRIFQALRIATNEELDSLKDLLPQAVALLKPGGLLAVVSFHSLEDRIVKQFIKKESTNCLCPSAQLICNCHHQASVKTITKKPIEAGEQELKSNPRSRSAKLRIFQKI